MKIKNGTFRAILAACVLAAYSVAGAASLSNDAANTADSIARSTQRLLETLPGMKQKEGEPPQDNKPIRFAVGKAVVSRVSINFENGKPTFERKKICTAETSIALYDLRKGPIASQGEGSIMCKDNLNGEEITVHSQAMAYIVNGKYADMEEDLKAVGIFSSIWAASGKRLELPEIPYQHTFTPDLHQKFFGIMAAPNQYIICQTQSGPRKFTGPQVEGKECKVVNPIAYHIQWTVEDNEQ